jgi:ketosteroid isomerase-like protein
VSREKVEICKRVWKTFKEGMERGDPGAGFDAGLSSPDFEWILPPGFPGPRAYRGREGFVEFMRAWTEDFEDFTLELERFVDAGGDRVVGLFHHRGIGRGSGAPVELHQGLLYELEDGKVVRCRNFIDHESALRAAGLGPKA